MPLAWMPLHPAWAQAPRVFERRALVFPRDHGSHNDSRTEWWYLTGWLDDARGQRHGFQVTFFRSRVDTAHALQSRLAARHLLFAHAALSDIGGGAFVHDQTMDRWNGEWQATTTGRSQARIDTTDIQLPRWRLQRAPDGRYQTTVDTDTLQLSLSLSPTQSLLLQGEQGWSRKGPDPAQASFYYSQPQLAVRGHIGHQGQRLPVRGTAWLDHEWSEALMHPDAVGWDWIGMNLHDGSSLTAFRLRRADGTALWAGGSWRSAARGAQPQPEHVFAAQAVQFEPLEHWTSGDSGIRYPTTWRVTTPAGRFTVHALMAAQELDSRPTTGAIYWEGLSELRDAQSGQPVGLGYLEMTGYGQPLRL